MKLYALTEEFEALYNQIQTLSDDELEQDADLYQNALDELGLRWDDVVINYVHIIKRLESEIDNCKKEADRIAKIKRARENNVVRIKKGYL